MSIRMFGVNHNDLSIEQREKFALNQNDIIAIFDKIKKIYSDVNMVIVSTCNRMEAWVYSEEDVTKEIFEIICEQRQLNYIDYVACFLFVDTEDLAIRDLFLLASGLRSRIIGEEQILTQIKSAIIISKEQDFIGKVLSVLFEKAISAGKKIRTDIKLPQECTSIIDSLLNKLRDNKIDLSGKRCMVLGNGVMGNEVTKALVKKGARVYMTVRQYKNSKVIVPVGCISIPYDERIRYLDICDIIVSATKSNHYTLTYEDFTTSIREKNTIVIDLAVPRDIEPRIADTGSVVLYNIDDFKVQDLSDTMKNYKKNVLKIMDSKIAEFEEWYIYKDLYTNIVAITDSLSEDIKKRMTKTLKKISDSDALAMEEAIDHALNKSLNKMFFCLKKRVDYDAFKKYVSGIYGVCQDELGGEIDEQVRRVF